MVVVVTRFEPVTSLRYMWSKRRDQGFLDPDPGPVPHVCHDRREI